jgi:hypothetical protein
MMRVIAASISDPAAKRDTLEMVVCLAPNGRLDPAVQDSVPQRCRMGARWVRSMVRQAQDG